MKICGIHTRLQNIIDKSGGYNVIFSARQLMKEYNIDDFEIAYEIANNHDIREMIKIVGIDRTIELVKHHINARRVKFDAMINMFGGVSL